MSAVNFMEFERLVRAYVTEEVSWDTVHEYAVEMDWTNATNFPLPLRWPLEVLHMAFLTADEGDEPPFRLDRSEISKLVTDLDQAWAAQNST